MSSVPQEPDIRRSDADAASLQRKAEEAEAKAKQAAAVPPGNQLPSDDANLESWQVDASADPISTWNRLVEEKLAAGKNRLDASVEVSAENPGLRDAMRAAFKPQNKRRE